MYRCTVNKRISSFRSSNDIIEIRFSVSLTLSEMRKVECVREYLRPVEIFLWEVRHIILILTSKNFKLSAPRGRGTWENG